MSAHHKITQVLTGLGFSKVGFTLAVVPESAQKNFDGWLKKQYHGSMAWMERGREKRADLQHVLPGAKTVICTATNYYTAGDTAEVMPAGRVSRYAWGEDYHKVIEKRQNEFVTWFQKNFPQESIKAYVDTGPLLEKALAEEAGLGWQGKHSNLITKEWGSWVFLAEFVTTLAIEPAVPTEDFCGTCTACIDACPTQAIVEPYVVDARQCLSYLTIEHRGDFTAVDSPTRPLGDAWIYGCDICQDVCPWNRFQTESLEPAFLPRPAYRQLTRAAIDALTENEFQTVFSGSPIRRAKLDGLKRNVFSITSASSSGSL